MRIPLTDCGLDKDLWVGRRGTDSMEWRIGKHRRTAIQDPIPPKSCPLFGIRGLSVPGGNRGGRASGGKGFLTKTEFFDLLPGW